MAENINKNKEEIGFTMDAGKLSNIFGYLTDINCEIPMTFFEDKIEMHQKSVDNIQYTEINIGEKDLIAYNPGLKHGNKYMNILIGTKLFDGRGMIELDQIDNMCDIATGYNRCRDDRDAVRRQYNVDVRVKPLEKKIEFHLPGNVIIWAKLFENEQYVNSEFEKLCKMPELVRNVRSDPNIKKSSVTMDSEMFDRLCCTDSRDNIFTAKIDKTDGLVLVSRSRDGFYELTLRPKCLIVECEEDNKEHIYIDKEYIIPFRIINDGPVTIEIRKNKPIVLERKLGEHTTVMLTAAPRIDIETNDIKDTSADLMAF